jgi:hypothetical protein
MIWGIQNVQTSVSKAVAEIALPRLVKIDSAKSTTSSPSRGIAAAVASSSSYLDVVRDFYWTYSKQEAREEVPTIFLKEKRLKVNALISQLKYTLGFVGGTIQDDIQKAADLINSNKTTQASYYNDVAGVVVTALGGAKNAVAGATALETKLEKQFGLLSLMDDNDTIKSSHWLQPYKGLYITEPTGWEFNMPYFDDKFETHGNQFSESGTVNPMSGLIQAATAGLTTIAEIAGTLTQPQNITYIERAKSFNFPTDGDDITIAFPLINTGSVDYNDVINNWQLIFLLLYNNKPGRISPTTVDQPVIYEVEIPGVKFYPYCYISSIDIKFQGARRELPIQIPYSEEQVGFNAAGKAIGVDQAASTRTINTIVPDAYYVTINLKSMVGNTKNFMYHMIDNGDRTKVGTR